MKRFVALFCTLSLILSCGGGKEDVTPVAEELGVPTNVKLHSATESSLTFQWSAVEGAKTYKWLLTKDGEKVKEGSVTSRNVTVDALTRGTVYMFSVCAVAGDKSSAYSDPVEARTEGEAPQPGAVVQCTDAPLVVEVGSGARLGTSGLIQVFKENGTLVDKIDLADIANVTILDDGTMVPKATINGESTFHTFMDALHSTRYRPVHYTPLRLKGGKLYIKLHNEALDFDGSYYLTMDESVVGKAIGKDDMPFSTKSAPSGTTLSVNADGSGDFCTVQGALSYATALGKDTAVTIEIGDGTYNELLYLRDKNNLTIKGASRTGVVIAYPNNESYATGSGSASNSKPSFGSAVGVMGGRCLFLVESCNELVIENLTIENTFNTSDHKGQAETIYFNGDSKKLTIGNCSLISWQDTFLCKGYVYVHDSLIAGHCDYIWGYPRACLFENCEIRSRAAGYIVQARVPGANDKGFVFLNCTLTAESGVADGSMYLARSGGETSVYDNVTFISCTMGPVIAPAGWHTGKTPTPSTPTATSGWKEYASVKPDGSSATSGRNSYGRILTASEAEPYSSRAAVLGW